MRDAVDTGLGLYVSYREGEFDYCLKCGTPTVKTSMRHGPIDGTNGRRPLKIRCRCPKRATGILGTIGGHTDQLVWPTRRP